MKLNRPDWMHPSNSHNKLPLHNNVCVDSVLIEKIQNVIESVDANALCAYPDQYDLYKTLSTHYNIPIKNIAIGLGSTELINRLIFLFKTEKIQIISPTFEMVRVYCDIYNVNFIEKYYTNFNQFDINCIDSNCVVYVASPNGNNGHSFNTEEIRYIISKSKIVILDEAYIDFSPNNSMLQDIYRYDNLIVVNTFSKSLGLAGIRCGYCFGNDNIIYNIQNIRMNYVSTGITNHIIKSLIDDIPASVERMLESRSYIQKKFPTINSTGNYCIMKKCEDLLSFCTYKEIGHGLSRVTLTNKNIFVNEFDN